MKTVYVNNVGRRYNMCVCVCKNNNYYKKMIHTNNLK